jgi:hypothetical protein
MVYQAVYCNEEGIVINIIDISENTQTMADSFIEAQTHLGAVSAHLESESTTGVGIGFKHLGDGVFQSPQPYPSWVWVDVENTIPHWSAPKPTPEDGKIYFWSEAELDWVVLNNIA